MNRTTNRNNMASVAMVFSLLGCVLYVPAVIGLVLGIKALLNSKKMGGDGRWQAIVAIVVGSVVIILWSWVAIGGIG